MKLAPFNFETINWDTIPAEEHTGESGVAHWQVFMMNDIRIRKVVYSPGYKADHWCRKGHIILCTAGEMDTALADGRIKKLIAGMTYVVGDDCDAHLSSTQTGCTLFIVD